MYIKVQSWTTEFYMSSVASQQCCQVSTRNSTPSSKCFLIDFLWSCLCSVPSIADADFCRLEQQFTLISLKWTLPGAQRNIFKVETAGSFLLQRLRCIKIHTVKRYYWYEGERGRKEGPSLRKLFRQNGEKWPHWMEKEKGSKELMCELMTPQSRLWQFNQWFLLLRWFHLKDFLKAKGSESIEYFTS